MTTETELPTADSQELPAAADDQTKADAAEATTTEATADEKPDTRTEREKELEAELERERKERARERRRIDNLTRRRYELESRLQGLQAAPIGDTNGAGQADSETVSLTKAELDALIAQRATELAPKVRDQAAESERLRNAARALQRELGEQFVELTEDLAAVIPDRDKQLAVLRSDAPAELLRYLTDPENGEEAERIARMDAFDAGRALAKIETKLAAKKAEAPQPSKAATPLTPVRAQGGIRTSAPTDTKAYVQWANKQYGRA